MDAQSVAVLLLIFTMGLSGLAAGAPVQSAFVYVYFTLVVFYFVIRSVIRTPYELLFIVVCYVALMTVYLGKSQWEYFMNGAGMWAMGVQRLQGMDVTFSKDNALAQSVNLSIPFLYLLFWVRKPLCASWPLFWRKLFVPSLVIYAGLALTSILLTRSRTGAVGFVLCIALLAWRERKSKVGLLICSMIGVSILIGFQFLPLDIQNRIRTLWDPEAGPKIAQKSAEGRWEGFQAGLKMFKDYPVTGVGVDNFIPYRIAHVDGVALGAHNLIGEILGETGLLGIAAFALFVSIALLNCHRVQRLGARAHGQIIPDIMRQMVLSCRDVIVLLFFHGMAAHNLDRYNWLWVAAFCSLAYNFAQTSTELDNASDLEMAPWTTLG